MAFRITVLFLHILFLLSLCRAQDVVVGLNDSSLVTNPPNVWGGGNSFTSSCDGVRYMDRNGESVSLSFTGTRITLEFLLDRVGRDAQIALDGKNVKQLSTFGDGALVLAGDCRPLSWSSDILPPARHTLTVTALDPPPNVTIPGWLDFRSFSYTPSADPSTPAITHTSNGNSIAASATTVTAANVNSTNAGTATSTNPGSAISANVGTVTVMQTSAGEHTITTLTTPTASTTVSSAGQTHLNVGLIAGVTTGIIGIVVISLIGALFFCRRRRRQSSMIALNSATGSIDGYPSYMTERLANPLVNNTTVQSDGGPHPRMESVPTTYHLSERAASHVPHDTTSPEPPSSLSSAPSTTTPARNETISRSISESRVFAAPAYVSGGVRGYVPESGEGIVSGDGAAVQNLKEALHTSADVQPQRVIDDEDIPPPAYAREV